MSSFSEKFVQIIQEHDLSIFLAFFSIVGAFVAVTKALSFWKLLFDLYLRPGKSLKQFGADTGAWAVITGASDGIGKEFACQLAAAKFNVLLISRTELKLQNLSNDIESKYQVESKTYAMDFAKGDKKDYENLKEIIGKLNVGVLINNVATNHEIPTPFILETDEVINNIVEVNVAGFLRITKIVLPRMISSNRGLIINVGSFSGMVPTPYLSVYSASKAFMSTFSAALGTELNSKGIVVENVNLYFVVSAMSKIRKSSWLVPQPKPCVKSILSKIGVSGGASNVPYSSCVYPSHALANWLITNTFNQSFWVNNGLSINEDIRKRALRKREREAAASKAQ
ncbi:101_t:CDS:2 [Funneliformis geosporum]|uniref:Very-long-chain 3-oxoacyl-CoA reductase n=1 Tax=Funneliformis geosporum TaxID=1117311 RepID=A0A9W4SI16_9GLOM|nr:101_t:CDS:2 [Funneliformis geosporum]CAI2169248.1 9208_t:CDS:2 [Funneliformis geosporum]